MPARGAVCKSPGTPAPHPAATRETGRAPETGLLVWSPPTKQHTGPCPRLPWPPTKPTPEGGNCPPAPSSLWGVGGRWRQPPGSPAPRLSPSPAFPSWVTLTQRTCGVPIYLQNIKKFIIYILTPVLPFYTCTSLEKVKIFKKRKRKGITRWE